MKTIRALVPLAILLLTACATVPEGDSTLQAARDAVQTAEQNPEVVKHASIALKEAREHLQRAEQGKNAEEVEHHAQLAIKQADVAQLRAEEGVARARLEETEQLQTQVQLEARERELQQLRRQMKEQQREADLARERLVQAQKELQDLQPQLTDRGLLLTLGEVTFSVGSANLQAGSQRAIQRLATYLQTYPDQKILIEGHTDSSGEADYNKRLSVARAEAIRDALVASGIDPDRVTFLGLGEDYPVASNDTRTGRAQNRRVEIVVSRDPTSRNGEVATAEEQVGEDVASGSEASDAETDGQ